MYKLYRIKCFVSRLKYTTVTDSNFIGDEDVSSDVALTYPELYQDLMTDGNH